MLSKAVCVLVYMYDMGEWLLCFTLYHKKFLFSTTNIGPKARTKTRTKCLQSSKDRKDRKWQDRNKPSVDRRESAVTRSLFLNGFRFRLGGKKYLVAVPKELDALDVNHVF